MNILLPERYECYDKDGELLAKIIDGVLYLYSPSSFKHVMYDITYKTFGKTCVYCDKEANSMDHRIPQDFGGPTIPDNMYPMCKDCNNEKANMLEEEYYEYIALEREKGAQKEYKRNLVKLQEKRRFGEIPTLPPEWLAKEEEKPRVLNMRFYVYEPLGSKYQHLLNFFNKYQRFQKPIIVSGNNIVLDGFNTLILSKMKNRYDFDWIILDNVIVTNQSRV